MNSEHGVTGRRRTAAWLLGAALLAMAGTSMGDGQSSGSGHPTPLDSGTVGAPSPILEDQADPLARTRQATQSRSYANDRQKKLIADADKLVELSNELKAEVSKSTKNDLSLTVIRKAAEIERLAHEMKDRERY